MFKKILPFLLFASPLAAQVQYEIIDVPVCWNDSSLIKYVYVTTSGAYADLGYYNAEGLPVTVAGATPTPGFCADALTIDSTAGRSFTITLGDQTVTWVDSVGSGTGGGGVDKLADLLDVDTAGLDSNYIIKYSPTAGLWKAYLNDISGLSNAYRFEPDGQTWLGTIPPNVTGIRNTLVGGAGFRLTTGFENVLMGHSIASRLTTGYGIVDIGGSTNNWYTQTGNNSVFIGNLVNLHGTPFVLDSVGTVNPQGVVLIGAESNTGQKVTTNEIAIGFQVTGNGSNTATLGNNNITATYLKGTTNLSGYGLGDKEASDLSKTGSAYLAAFATDGTLIELDTTGLFGGSTGATTLGDLTDVTLTSPQINDILKYDGTKWINDTLSVSSGGVLSVTANNGLTNSGTATQPVIELGGTLSKNTTVSGDSKSLYFNDNLFFYIDTVYSFLVRPSVNQVANTFNIGAAANSWRSANTTAGIGNLIEIQADNAGDGVFLSSYLTATTTTYTKLELLPEEVQLITPNVNASTATAGQVLTLVDAATGEVEFSSPSTGIALSDLSVTVAAAGSANLSYNNTSGVFTYTPPDLSGYLTAEVDGSTTNELQNLSLAGTTLSISDGNSVDLSGLAAGGFTLPTDSITFNANTADAVAGKLQYNTDYNTLVFGAANNVPIKIGTDAFWLVKNQTGSPITKGTVVRAAGTLGTSGRILIDEMIADGTIPGKYLLGVAAETIANGADGFVMTHGELKGLTLTGFSDGDVLYTSAATAGEFTNTEPTAPNLKQPIAFVVDADPGGIIAVRVETGVSINDISEIQVSSPANGEVLKYDGTKWANATDAVDDADADATNELQDLSLAGATLSISDGNSVEFTGFLRDTLTGTQTIVGNTNDYIFNGINDYQINLTGDKAFYVGHSKMYIRFDATEMKLYSSDTPINIQGVAGVNLEFAGGDYKFDNTAMQLEAYGSGNKEAGDLSKTPSDYKAAFATDGTLIEVSNIDAMVIACSDETTDITTGTAKVTFRAPHAMTITGVRASLTTASSSGDPTVDINEGGTSILGTKLSIDANEKTSTTAATPATITDDTIADDAEITIDIDAAGTGATGLKVTILYRKN